MNATLEELLLLTCNSLETGHLSPESLKELASTVGQSPPQPEGPATLLRYRAIAAIIRQSLDLSKMRTSASEPSLEKTWGRQGASPDEADVGLEKTWGRQGASPDEADVGLEKTWGRQGASPDEADVGLEKTWGRQGASPDGTENNPERT